MIFHCEEDSCLCSTDVYLSIKTLSNQPVGNGVSSYPNVVSNTITLLVTDRITPILNTNKHNKVNGCRCIACLISILLQKCFYTANFLEKYKLFTDMFPVLKM